MAQVKAEKIAPGVKSAGPTRAFVKKVIGFFDEYYPEAGCSLEFHDPFQLLAATILSAQCTDERVNRTTPGLFRRFPDARSMAQADPEELEEIIKPCGFYHNKAKSLLGMSQKVTEEYGGRIPETLEELVKLPGVGRKTANVVLGNAFGVPGLTVDTHLGRVSRRLGLSASQDPEKVEADLAAVIPRERWTLFSHQAIHHGRALCRSQRPLCHECPFFKSCPRIGVADKAASKKK
ncbi:endonuclease III [Deltaproteobacteria bacterium Smac51]|nr:endonuclease III [Deltaproteobacteria bacterium Smac51]